LHFRQFKLSSLEIQGHLLVLGAATHPSLIRANKLAIASDLGV
jgi:hypothetical protein